MSWSEHPKGTGAIRLGIDEENGMRSHTFVSRLRCRSVELLLMLGTLAMLFGGRSQAQSSRTLPPEVRAGIPSQKDCVRGERAVFQRGFIVQKDINGDGIDDYILDYGKFLCGGSSPYCGSAGCLTQVFASLAEGSFVKVLDENVRALRFVRIGGRPAMLVGLHGSACGRVGAEPCGVTLFWNGQKFSPAN